MRGRGGGTYLLPCAFTLGVPVASAEAWGAQQRMVCTPWVGDPLRVHSRRAPLSVGVLPMLSCVGSPH